MKQKKRYQHSQNQLRDDLIWAITSPSMMALDNNITYIPQAQELAEWFDAEDHANRLISYIEERNPRRLGIYFEVLWHYFLEQHPDFRLISRNLAVRNGERTLGEFDFIFYCRRRERYVHLETAVKFYLGVNDTLSQISAWNSWVGPGRKDRLDLKLNKMLRQQTRLSLTPEGAEQLALLGVADLLTEICIKGYFFYPHATAYAPPEQCDPEHLRGTWLKLKDLTQISEKGFWTILDKESWLSPFCGTGENGIYAFSELRQLLETYFSTSRFPVMLALLRQQDEVFWEQTRYFVTDDRWPL